MFDAMLIIIWAVVTWCVAGEGAFGAALNCLIVVLSGLLAMNLFEPAAGIGQSIMGSAEWAYRWDVIALVGLFAAFVLGLRFLFERWTPRYFAMDEPGDSVGRWLFGAVTGYVTMRRTTGSVQKPICQQNGPQRRTSRGSWNCQVPAEQLQSCTAATSS